MAFYEKEVATKCWYPSAMGADASVNHFLAPESDPLLMTTPNLLNVCRPPPSAYGVSGVDTAASGFLQSPLTQTTSETDSGTATTTTPTEHFGRPHMNKQKSLYKTELCRSWEEKGRCPYGNKCQFAHGTQELRPVARHPKFKTEVCCTFVTTGTCPYGRRCRFIHKNVPITAVGKQVCDITKKNEPFISSANSITASSRRLPIFVKLARGEL